MNTIPFTWIYLSIPFAVYRDTFFSMTSLSLRRSWIDLSAQLTSGGLGVGVDDARRDSASNRSLRDTMSLGVTGGGMTPLSGDPKSLMCDDIIDSSSSLS